MKLSRSARLALVAALGALTIPLNQPAAVAGEGGSYDITSLRANKVVVRSSSCINVPFTVNYRTGIPADGLGAREVDFSADIEVWRGPKNLDTTFVYKDVTTSAANLSLSDYYVYCPSYEGMGTIRIGPSQVDGTTYDGDFDTVDSDQFLDRTTGTYVAKQASRSALSIAKVKGKPKQRQFTVRPQYFSLNASSWRAWVNKGVALQRSTPAGWKAVRTIRANNKGVGTLRLNVAKGGKYRAVVPGAAQVWPATSVTRTSP